MIAVFTASALVIALTAGFGLGLWLLLARTLGLPTGDLVWLSLVQVHGTIQLFGFAAMFVMGVGLHVLPRFRAAPPAPRMLAWSAYAATLSAIVLRASAQPVLAFPGRDVLLPLSGLLLILGTTSFAAAALRALRGGTNPHRPDELVMTAGVLGAPIAALFVALEFAPGSAPLLVDPQTSDRAVWAMLLGCLATTIFGVWARLSPGFMATPPAPRGRLLAGTALWLVGAAGMVAGVPFGSFALAAGLVTLVSALGVFGPSIARQRLVEHALLTQLAVRTAFLWALAGAALLAIYDVRTMLTGAGATYLEVSAARHAFALGFVTLMIFGVAARALPAFLARRLWSPRLQLATIVLVNLGVALRVAPQAVTADGAVGNGIVGLSGALAYAALVAFAINVVRTLRGPALPPPARSTPAPIAFITR